MRKTEKRDPVGSLGRRAIVHAVFAIMSLQGPFWHFCVVSVCVTIWWLRHFIQLGVKNDVLG